MHQTHDAPGDRGSSSYDQSLADSSERLRTSVTSQDVMQYQRSQNNTGTEKQNNTGTENQSNAGTKSGDSSDKLREVDSNKVVQIKDDGIHFPVVSTPEEFRLRVLRIFAELDRNNDGYLGRDELGKAVENHEYEGEDAQVVAGLYNKDVYNTYVNVSDDQTGAETKLSVVDINRMNIVAGSQEVYKASAISEFATKNFASLDLDKDGYIEFSEVDTLSRRNKAGDDPKWFRMLDLLKEKIDVIEDAHWDQWFWEEGASKADFPAYAKSFKSEMAQADAMSAAQSSARYISGRTRDAQMIEGADQLYGNVGADRAINPDAIRQGTVGDCYFLAPLASLAKTDPGLIERMIKDNRDGTYTVTFPGDKEHPVTVAAPTDAEQGLYNGGSRYGTWAGIVERAFGKWRLEHANSRVANPTTTVEAADGGDSPQMTMKLLTGNSSAMLEVKAATSEDMANDLDFALNRSGNRSAVTAGTNAGDGVTKDGWSRNHLYSVIGFIRVGQDGGLVKIRNPWGLGSSRDGTIQITLSEFSRNFDYYNVERNPKHRSQ